MNEQRSKTSDVIHRFHEAFARHDSSSLKDLVAEDCVMESVEPAPDGSGMWAATAAWRSGRTAKDPMGVMGASRLGSHSGGNLFPSLMDAAREAMRVPCPALEA